MITHVGSSVFLGGQGCPRTKGAGPIVPQNFGLSTRAHTVRETTKFGTVIKLDVRKILHDQPRMLTRDLLRQLIFLLRLS